VCRAELFRNVESIHLKKGDSFTFFENEPRDESSSASSGNCVQAKGVCGNVLAGDKIFVDDGLLSFTVIRSNLEGVECVADNCGVLENRKGINLVSAQPGKKPFLKRKDREDLSLARELQVEFVTVSCVRNVQDLSEIKELLYPTLSARESSTRSPRLLSKIENKSGLESFEAILSQSDGIIIDRGYLGVEIDLASISTVQKLLVERCTLQGKPVLIANHILESMRDQPRPSRSEASDISSAVFLGGDGYILSSETAIGSYPVESLQWLRRICTESETHLNHLDFQLRLLKAQNPKPISISESIASSTVKCAREVDAACIIVSTEGGGMARLIAKYRPSIPIVAGCGNDHIAGQLAVSFGIIPVVVKCEHALEQNNGPPSNTTTKLHTVDPSQVVYDSLKHASLSLNLIENGNRVVVASGQVDGFLDGSSTFMQVFTVGEDCLI
jgi:pyruvate kinase